MGVPVPGAAGAGVAASVAGPRWWEAAGGAHAFVQIVYLLIGLTVGVGVWLVRIEVHDAHTEDHFAVVDAQRQERGEMKADLVTLRADLVDLRVAIVRLDSRIEGLKGRR